MLPNEARPGWPIKRPRVGLITALTPRAPLDSVLGSLFLSLARCVGSLARVMSASTNEHGLRTRPSPYKTHLHAGSGGAAGGAGSASASACASAGQSASVLRAFSSFLLSPAYHSSEREVRQEGTVDLSRRSGGGQRLEFVRSANKKAAAAAAAAAKQQQQQLQHLQASQRRGPIAGMAGAAAAAAAAAAASSAASAAAAAAASPFPQPRFDLADLDEDQEKDKGDFAIVIRLESKIVTQHTLSQRTI